jgi:alkanesulfonate monooxygenase SsuD/methylene tetrahydromethanopterin reductase-like flavin-dependent oxidoreductase (luciferase family)
MPDVGVGLWTMRSTAAHPVHAAAAYAALARDALHAETLGFHSLWLAEHHFWYDGWCPAPVAAAAAVLSSTSTLKAGTGVHLLPLWDPSAAAAAAETLVALAGERLYLGVGLGYRDEEFDGFGLSRRTRGRRMDVALDELTLRWGEGCLGPRVLVGGFSAAAMARAGTRGLGIFLPFSLSDAKLAATIERYREAALEAGRTPGMVGMLKYAWVTDGSGRQREAAERLIAASALEYSGCWFELNGRSGFAEPELLARQLSLATANALIGTPDEIAEQIARLDAAGVDLVVLQVTRDDVSADHLETMEALATALFVPPPKPST